jgi:hypothetical protein
MAGFALSTEDSGGEVEGAGRGVDVTRSRAVRDCAVAEIDDEGQRVRPAGRRYRGDDLAE